MHSLSVKQKYCSAGINTADGCTEIKRKQEVKVNNGHCISRTRAAVGRRRIWMAWWRRSGRVRARPLWAARTGTERSQFKQINAGGGRPARPVKSADVCSCAGNINLSLVLLSPLSPSHTPLIYESRPSASKLMAGVSWNHEPAPFTSAPTAAPHCTIANGNCGYIKPTTHLCLFFFIVVVSL